MNRSKIILFLLLPLLLLLVACPYSSSFKVGEPQTVDENQWNGAWYSSKIEDGTKIQDELIFKKTGNNQLSVQTQFHVLRSDRPAKLKLKGFPVTIGGKKLLLLYNPKRNSNKEFMYLGYDFKESGELQIKILSDEKVPEKIASASELEKWLIENYDQAAIWEDTISFHRAMGLLKSK
jgi:hypothetical protein